MKRANIIGVAAFILLIPVVVILYSYSPANRIRLAADSSVEYFRANILHGLGLKCIVSAIFAAAAAFLVRASLLKKAR